MVSFTLSSALVAALTATAANAAGNFAYFTAHTVVTSGQMKFTGKFLTSRHTGTDKLAGTDTNAIIVSSNYTEVTQFQQYGASSVAAPKVGVDGTAFYFFNLLGQPAYRRDTQTADSKTPIGYYNINSEAGVDPVEGYTVGRPEATAGTGTLNYTGDEFTFGSFAVCSVENELGDVDQLFWRNVNTKSDETGQCADVELYINFEE